MFKYLVVFKIKLFGFFLQESYQPCRQAGVIGLCQPVRSCDFALRLLQGTITSEVQQFLRNIQCSSGFDGPWVCCASTQTPNQTTRPPAQPLVSSSQSKGSLPRAPQCGIDAPNRIFGGTETRIDEFPWLVQIQYNKRKRKNIT